MDTPATKFAHSRGARIAYQDFGDSPHIVVAIPPQAQNVEEAWTWPAVRTMLERFGSFSRWINFDKRGTGASDRRSRMPGIDERVDDLRAVMDHAGVERAHLYGASEGGPTCVLFAVTYPERVQSLTLHGTGPYTAPRNLSTEERAHYMERAQFMADKWGTDESPVAAGFAPSLAHDAEFIAWHQRYERRAADSASLVELLEISLDVDVTDVLPLVDVPTLVLHNVDDPVIPVAWGRALAEGIHGAEIVEFEGADHFGYAGDQSWLDHLERFVTGTVQESTGPAKSSNQVVIQSLGDFAVEVDGSAISPGEWGSAKARQLCKRLVAERGWPVRREELFDMLWPDETDLGKLGARLSVQLSHVRRILNGGIVADRSTVALDLGTVTTDLEVILASDASAEQILEAHRGEFLPADVYEDWAAAPREQARTAFITAALEIAEQRAGEGDHPGVIALTDRVLALDPYHEPAHERAVSSYLDAADRAGALRAHQRRVEAMAELGIDVS